MEIDLPVATVLGFMPNNKYLDLATVSKLFSRKYTPRVTAIDQHTSLNNMAEYFESGMPATENVPRKAAEMGRLDLFQLAVQQGCIISHKTMEVAANKGHLDIIKCIDNHTNAKLCPVCMCQGASRGGHLYILKFLFPADAWLSEQLAKMLVRNAVLNGHLSVVKWVHEKGLPLDSALLSTAATHGHFELVKYIHYHQTRPDNLGEHPISVVLHAALKGSLQTLVWLRERGYPWSNGICLILARRGHLEALKYARSNGCAWGALKIGSVGPVIDSDMRSFLVQDGCPV